MLPNNKVKILLFFLSFLIGILLAFNVAISRYGAFWQKPKSSSVVILPTPSSAPLILASPVESELIKAISPSSETSDHLVFFLPKETAVYAVFDGEVSKVVPGSEFDNIQLVRDDGLVASYLLVGQVLVQEGQKVVEGEMIAKIKEGQGPGCLKGGNLGLYLFKDGEPLRLGREMLK